MKKIFWVISLKPKVRWAVVIGVLILLGVYIQWADRLIQTALEAANITVPVRTENIVK